MILTCCSRCFPSINYKLAREGSYLFGFGLQSEKRRRGEETGRMKEDEADLLLVSGLMKDKLKILMVLA